MNKGEIMGEKIEPLKIDKSGWPDGPWKEEPDKVNWIYNDMDCMIVRHSYLGHLCGYVAVNKSHPLHGKGYDEAGVDVHGGLTYADECSGPICHVPEAGRPADVWWFGFDCAHLGDQSPNARDGFSHGDFYRSIQYVKNETERLADQLKAVR